MQLRTYPHANKFWSSGQFTDVKATQRKKAMDMKFTQRSNHKFRCINFVFFVDFQEEVIKFRPEFIGI